MPPFLSHTFSFVGLIPNPYTPDYTASKHALLGFFDALRLQFIKENINVSISNIMLGPISKYSINHCSNKQRQK